jgi:hypothetical protein
MLLDYRKSAEYCRMDVKLFKAMVAFGTGPAMIRPSPRKTLFDPADLDAWVKTWDRKPAKSAAVPCEAIARSTT